MAAAGNVDKRTSSMNDNGASMKECFQLLLKKGIDVNTWVNEDGETALHALTQEGELGVVEVLLQVKADANGRRDNNHGDMSIYDMSMRRFFSLLAKKGFDVNTWVNKDGETALHALTQEDRLEMVEVLLEVKADANCKDKAGDVPLVVAARQGHADVASLLLKHGAKTHPGVVALHTAAVWGKADVVRVLIGAGGEVMEVNAFGVTAARACLARPKGLVGEIDASLKRGKAEALLAILQSGADVNEFKVGNSLLHDAAVNDLPGCVTVLVERGLDPNVRTNGGGAYSPLQLACFSGSVSVVKELSRLGASVDALDACSRSPLFDAVARGHDACVCAMIDLGASLDIRNKWGFTPLHVSAAVGQVKCAYLLLEGGAPVDALSNDGLSPLMVCMKPDLLPDLRAYSVQNGSEESRTRVARLLLEMEANVDDEVIQYAAEGEMNAVLAESMRRLRSMNKSLIGNTYSIANTLLTQREEVVHIKLVNRATGEVADHRYTLNTQLMQHLIKAAAGGGVGGAEPPSSDASANETAPSSVMSTLLDPGSRGFKGQEDGEEVTIKYDGVDFTIEGFGAVVEYLTTGRIDRSLLNTTRVGGTEGGESKADEADSHRNDGNQSENSSGGSVNGKRKRSSEGEDSPPGKGPERKRRCLFDCEMAAKALQASGYFCLEGMTEEVQRLMDAYGFDYDDKETGVPVAANK